MNKRIVEEIPDDSPSIRLVLSPDKTTIVSVHKMASTISVFHVEGQKDSLRVKKIRTIDFSERIEDAVFGKDRDHIYLISSSKYRFFGYSLKTDEVFWGMRTGGVRPRAGFKQIQFIRQ
jgi:hypothetical protein